MLSLGELERVASVLSDTLVGGRIERWLEPEQGRIVFSIYRRGHHERRYGMKKKGYQNENLPNLGSWFNWELNIEDVNDLFLVTGHADVKSEQLEKIYPFTRFEKG